jgi:hypothetical protein
VRNRAFVLLGRLQRAASMGPMTKPPNAARFRGALLLGHKGHAVEVPFDPGVRWSSTAQPLRPGRRGYLVDATAGGVAFASAIVARSKRFWLLVPDAVMREAGAVTGDTVLVTVAPR